MVDIKTLKTLVRLMVDNDLTELNIQSDEEKISLKRQGDHPVQVTSGTGTASVVAAPAAANAVAPAQPAPPPAASAPAPDDVKTINSPMVGTFYTAPSPDAKPYVSVGDRVESDSVVCIIEAMKVFNEIKAEVSGRITRLLVNSGEAVEFGTPLFEVKPE